MEYRLQISDDALDDLRRLDKAVTKRILKKLRFFITSGKPLEFAEHLTDFQEGEYRFHIGHYRATFDAKYKGRAVCVVSILLIDHRKDVYR